MKFPRSVSSVFLCMVCLVGGWVRAAVPVEALLDETRFQGGLVLVHEPESIRPWFAVTDRGDALVLAVVEDEDRLMAMRREVDGAGRAGRVLIHAPGADGGLPVIDHFARLVVDEGGGLAPEEFQRACSPYGHAAVLRDGGWVTRVRPLPDNMDEWYEWEYTAAGNPVNNDTALGRPTTLRWTGGPGVHAIGGMGADTGFRFSDGVAVFSETGVNEDRLTGQSSGTALVARDAFSGVQMWRRPTDGSAELPNQFAFIARHGKLFAQLNRGEPMHRLNLFTGETEMTYDQGLYAKPLPPEAPRQKFFQPEAKSGPVGTFLVARWMDGILFQTDGIDLVALDAETGRRLWSHKPGAGHVGWIVADEGRLYVTESRIPWGGLRGGFFFQVDRVLALDAKTGRELWAWQGPGDRASTRMVASRGDVLIPHFSQRKHKGTVGYQSDYFQRWRVTRLDGETGKVLWETDEDRGAQAHYQISLDHPKWGVFVVGQSGFRVDPENGSFRSSFNFAPFDGCGEVRATPNYLFYTMDFRSFSGDNDIGEDLDPGIARSSCDTGSFPAYGAIHTSPSQCGCNDYPPGYNSITTQSLPPELPEGARLVKGPAYAGFEQGATAPWPQFLGRADRGGSTSAKGPSNPLLRWTTSRLASFGRGAVGTDWEQDDQADGPLTGLTVGPRGVYTADRRGGVVIALDPQSGAVLWRYPTGGPIDAPPTVVGNRVIAGGQDGQVYALRDTDGELAWRFTAARSTTRHLAGRDSSLVSRWAAGGSPLWFQNSLYVIAGRHSSAEDGLRIWRLDPATGRVLATNRIATTPEDYNDLPPRSVPDTPDGVKNYGGTRRGRGLLSGVGDQIIHRWEGFPADLSVPNVPTYEPAARKFNVEAPYRPEKPALFVRQYFLNTTRRNYGRYFYTKMTFPSAERDNRGQPRSYREELIAVDDDLVVGGSGSIEGFARNAAGERAEKLWSVREVGGNPGVDGRRTLDAIAISDNHVYVAAANRVLGVIDRRSGELVANVALPGRVHKHGLAVGHGKVYATLVDGTVAAVADVKPGDVVVKELTPTRVSAVAGQEVRVSWNVENATKVYWMPGRREVDTKGATTFEVPESAPDYRLVAEGPGGPVVRNFSINLVEPIPGRNRVAGAVPGLRAAYTSRVGDPAKTGILPSLFVKEGGEFLDSGMSDHFVGRFEGWIRVPETGYYRFKLFTDDGGSLKISGETVAANGGFGRSEGSVALAAGWHPVQAMLDEKQGGAAFEVEWKIPGTKAFEPLPADVLFHVP